MLWRTGVDVTRVGTVLIIDSVVHLTTRCELTMKLVKVVFWEAIGRNQRLFSGSKNSTYLQSLPPIVCHQEDTDSNKSSSTLVNRPIQPEVESPISSPEIFLELQRHTSRDRSRTPTDACGSPSMPAIASRAKSSQMLPFTNKVRTGFPPNRNLLASGCVDKVHEMRFFNSVKKLVGVQNLCLGRPA
jgi:hypothetical protein